MATYFIAVANDIPNYKFNKKKKLEKWWQENKANILNLDTNPLVNIDTGEIFE